MHPRISINQVLCLDAPLAEDVDMWRAIEPPGVTVFAPKLELIGRSKSVELLKTMSRSSVTGVVHPSAFSLDQPDRWPEQLATLCRAVDLAAALGASVLYTTTGPAGRQSWEEAAAAFVEAVQPARAYAEKVGIRLLVETTSHLHADLSILYSLPDLLEVCDRAGLGVCVDMFPCWAESKLYESLKRAAPKCGLVQVSDYVLGDRSLPCRAVPGDGAAPVETMIKCLLEHGYSGMFDLELRGPRIDAEGPVQAVIRSAAWLTEVLERLGA